MAQDYGEQAHVDSEKSHLVVLLDEARAYTRSVLHDTDPQRVVHRISGWTVRDVVGHILVWEEEALRALQALHAGQPAYTIPDFVSFEDYNAHCVTRWQGESFEEIVASLDTVRERIKTLLLSMPPDRFEHAICFPWPAEGTLSMLMLIMAAHERGHVVEIARALD